MSFRENSNTVYFMIHLHIFFRIYISYVRRSLELLLRACIAVGEAACWGWRHVWRWSVGGAGAAKVKQVDVAREKRERATLE